MKSALRLGIFEASAGGYVPKVTISNAVPYVIILHSVHRFTLGKVDDAGGIDERI